MKVTIIIAVHNGAKTLQACLTSIAKQSYLKREVIVMDAESSDGSVDILLRNDSLITYWESKKDRGIAHAWNKALDHISGDWIIFLGADDRLFDEHVLSDMVSFLKDDCSSDLVYGKMVFEGGKFDGLQFGEASRSAVLKRRMNFPHTATFHRKSFFDKVGRFDETFKIAIDYELVLRKKDLLLRFVNRSVSIMGGEGLSSTLIIETLQEFRQAQLKNRVSDWYIIETWYLYYGFRYLLNKFLTKFRYIKATGPKDY